MAAVRLVVQVQFVFDEVEQAGCAAPLAHDGDDASAHPVAATRLHRPVQGGFVLPEHRTVIRRGTEPGEQLVPSDAHACGGGQPAVQRVGGGVAGPACRRVSEEPVAVGLDRVGPSWEPAPNLALMLSGSSSGTAPHLHPAQDLAGSGPCACLHHDRGIGPNELALSEASMSSPTRAVRVTLMRLAVKTQLPSYSAISSS